MNLKHLAIITCVMLLLVGCKQETYTVTTTGGLVTIPTQNYFFDFDEMIYYSATEEHTMEMFTNKDRSLKDSIIENLIGDYHHTSLNDTIALSYLDSMGFDKKIIPNSKHAALKEIFREKSYTDDGATTSCEPVFRDMFVFKKEGKVSGIAKICYGCDKHQIMGTAANTEGFGESGEYKKLADIVAKR